MSGDEHWSEYARLARRLDEVRRGEAERTARQSADAQSGRAALDALVDRLTEQQADLHAAATALRLRMPLVDPPPSGAATAREALERARAAAEAADRERERALESARLPSLLPGRPAWLRNTVVYAACAGVALVVQLVLVLLAGTVDPVSATLWSLCALPAIAYVAGWFLTGVVGTPRIATLHPTGDPGTRVPVPRSPRLGFAICFLALPVAWLGLALLRQITGV